MRFIVSFFLFVVSFCVTTAQTVFIEGNIYHRTSNCSVITSNNPSEVYYTDVKDNYHRCDMCYYCDPIENIITPIDTVTYCYVETSKHICHSTYKCPNIKSQHVKKRNYQKALYNSYRCKICYDNGKPVDDSQFQSINNVTVFQNSNQSTLAGNIDFAGNCLKKSAVLDYTAVGFTIASSICLGITASYNVKNNETTTAGYYVAGALGLAGFITEMIAINYKMKAGQSLRIGATKVTYNF